MNNHKPFTSEHFAESFQDKHLYSCLQMCTDYLRVFEI